MSESSQQPQPPWEQILRDLEANIVTHGGKEYLVAGQHQFKTIWFRDVCFALLVLMECPRNIWERRFAPIIRNTVDLYQEFFREDLGYGPKCVDTRSPEVRCVYESVRHAIMYRVFGRKRAEEDMDPSAKFSGLYQDGRQSVAIDSNILVYTVAAVFGMPTQRDPKLRRLLEWYERAPQLDQATGLIAQGPHSDWQDSVSRAPHAFHIHLLYWKALRHTPGRDAEACKARILQAFRDPKTGMIRAMTAKDAPYICLDDQLLAVHWGFLPMHHFHARVRGHELWVSTPVPGFPTVPDYPDPHWQVKLAGLSNYHSSLHWSWLIALCGIVAFECGDREEGERIFEAMWRVFKVEQGVSELYDLDGSRLKQLERVTYQAECPWTWGIAFMLRLAVQRWHASGGGGGGGKYA